MKGQTMKNSKKSPRVNQKMVDAANKQRDMVTKALIDAMGKGYDWAKDWTTANAGLPISGSSGKTYQGRNLIGLWGCMLAYGFSDPRFYTLNAVVKNGWKLKDDAHLNVVEKWMRVSGSVPIKDKNGDPVLDDDGNMQWITRAYMKLVGGWYVVNAEEIVGPEKYSAAHLAEPVKDLAGDLADKLIRTSRCPVFEELGDRAYYRPIHDDVHVPRREQFGSNEGFLRTLLHEMGHSTMVPAHRAAIGKFGSPEYAFEELIAELSSVFVAGDLGFPVTTPDFRLDENSEFAKHHAAYLASWIKSLDDDPDYVYRAASKASRAAWFIENRLKLDDTEKVV